jgi:hypothetical protein
MEHNWRMKAKGRAFDLMKEVEFSETLKEVAMTTKQ